MNKFYSSFGMSSFLFLSSSVFSQDIVIRDGKTYLGVSRKNDSNVIDVVGRAKVKGGAEYIGLLEDKLSIVPGETELVSIKITGFSKRNKEGSSAKPFLVHMSAQVNERGNVVFSSLACSTGGLAEAFPCEVRVLGSNGTEEITAQLKTEMSEKTRNLYIEVMKEGSKLAGDYADELCKSMEENGKKCNPVRRFDEERMLWKGTPLLMLALNDFVL